LSIVATYVASPHTVCGGFFIGTNVRAQLQLSMRGVEAL